MNTCKTWLVVLLAIVFTTSTALAQDDDEKDPPVSLDLEFAVGLVLSLEGEDVDTFTFDQTSLAIHADLIGWDFMDASSGLGIEVALGGDLEYTVWSLNRMDIPGTGGRIYTGGDMKLLQSSNTGGVSSNFDFRIPVGVNVGDFGPVDLRVEATLVEENRPISVAVLVGF